VSSGISAMMKEFKLYKERNSLSYRDAMESILDVIIYGIIQTGTLPKKDELEAIPFIKLYCDLAKDNPFDDHLGKFYMEVVEHYSTPDKGQYFTPIDVCKLISALTHSGDRTDQTSFNDPTCGFGAMLISLIEVHTLPTLYIEANDIDLLCCKATFIQLFIAACANRRLKTVVLNVTNGDILRTMQCPSIYKLVLNENSTKDGKHYSILGTASVERALNNETQ
jgi:hypothetical protein